MRQLNVAGKIYAASVVLIGAAAVPVGFYISPLRGDSVGKFIFLAVAAQIAALMPIRWSSGNHLVTTAPLIAIGLLDPGGVGGTALVAWLCLFDGRLPGRDLSWLWALFNRANVAITFSLVSFLVALIPNLGMWSIPVKTVAYSAGVIAVNYPLTALAFAFINRTSILAVLTKNVRLATVQATLILGFAGGTMYVLLERPVGYLMAPGLLGVLIAVRSNVRHAQRQAEARQQTLQLAAQALDARDKYTESHSQRVGELAAQIGRALGFGLREIEDLRTAGSLHDLGKIGIPDHILNKAEALSPEEWTIMKTHSDIGADMISQHSALAPVAPFVRHHHERWDGSGYPQCLQAEGIPLGARILAVADSFDTMTSPRLYRKTFLSQAAAVDEISSLASRWYDPKVVDALRSLHHLPALSGLREPTRQARLPAGLALLRDHPPFARLVLGMSVSSLGDPLTTVATLVSIYAITHQALALAGVYVLKAIATILMGSLGGVVPDRLDRKRLILLLETVGGVTLLLTPLALKISLIAIFPIIFLLAAINAIVQPTRQAIIPELVGEAAVGSGAATIAGATMVTSMLGFPLAAAILWLSKGTSLLFVVDGVTFIAAGLLVIGIGKVGGGAARRLIGSGIRETWRVPHARPQLVVSALAAFFISMSFPTLLVLAYQLADHMMVPAQAYTLLEATLAVGIVCGSVLVSQLRDVGTMRLVLVGLTVMGILSIGIGVSSYLVLTAALLIVASVGNAVYGVANQTALLQAGDSGNRGRIMSSRFAIVQTGLIAGALIGGLITGWIGPRATYMLLGAGLLVVALTMLATAARIQRMGGSSVSGMVVSNE